MTLADMRRRLQIAFAVIPGQQHVFADQFVGDHRGTFDGSVKIECCSD